MITAADVVESCCEDMEIARARFGARLFPDRRTGTPPVWSPPVSPEPPAERHPPGPGISQPAE